MQASPFPGEGESYSSALAPGVVFQIRTSSKQANSFRSYRACCAACRAANTSFRVTYTEEEDFFPPHVFPGAVVTFFSPEFSEPV